MIDGILFLCIFQSIMIIVIFICVIEHDDVGFIDYKLSNFLITTNNKLQFLTECIIEMKHRWIKLEYDESYGRCEEEPVIEGNDMEAVGMLRLNEWKYKSGGYYTIPILINVNDILSVVELDNCYVDGSKITMSNDKVFIVQENTEDITHMIF